MGPASWPGLAGVNRFLTVSILAGIVVVTVVLAVEHLTDRALRF